MIRPLVLIALLISLGVSACGNTPLPSDCTVIKDDSFKRHTRVRTIEDPYEIWLFAQYIHHVRFRWYWSTSKIDVFYGGTDTFLAVTSDHDGCALMSYTLHWELRYDILGQGV